MGASFVMVVMGDERQAKAQTDDFKELWICTTNV
jgi:hypothetical protein